jgi:hypothetical protein
MEASTPQSRRREIAMRSWTGCTAAAEYCEQPQQMPMIVPLLIATDFFFYQIILMGFKLYRYNCISLFYQ